MIRSGKRRILSTFILALAMVMQPFGALASTASATTFSTVCAVDCNYTTIADAVNGVDAGDTIVIEENQNITSTVQVNKPVTITGYNGSEVITTSGSAHVFVTTAPNVTISNLNFVKTDKAFQNMINVQGANTSITDNTFAGQYTLAANDHTSRALEISTTAGLLIDGNSFENLRQPAYLNDNTAGTISNNYVNQTRGWVAVANTNLAFTDNTWGVNAVDIAFIPGTPNNYSDILAVSAANNGAVIHNQVSGTLNVVYVDGSVASTGNGYQASPYKTLAEALATVVSGGVIEVESNLSIAQQVTVTKAVTIKGNGHTVSGAFVKTDNSNNSVIGVQSDDVKIYNLTTDAVSGAVNMLHGINVYDSSDVVLSNIVTKNGRTGVVVGQGSTVSINGISTSGNIWHGINVDKSGSHLTISGTNSHNEARPIFVDNKTVGTVVDQDGKYSVFENGSSWTYVLKSSLSTGAAGSVSLPVVSGTAKTPVDEPLVIETAQATAVIPEGTTITSSPAWNGVINAPALTGFTVPGTVNTGLAISVGSEDYSINFDRAVQLRFPGQAGKLVGFKAPGGSFTEITAVCETFDPDQANALLALANAQECKFSYEGVLYVWTKHFTTFATFTAVAAPRTTQSNNSSSQPRRISSTYASPYTYDDTWMEGANTEEGTDKPEVLSESAGLSSTSTVADATPREVPANGLAWYWWLFGVVLATGAWSLVAALRSGRFNRS